MTGFLQNSRCGYWWLWWSNSSAVGLSTLPCSLELQQQHRRLSLLTGEIQKRNRQSHLVVVEVYTTIPLRIRATFITPLRVFFSCTPSPSGDSTRGFSFSEKLHKRGQTGKFALFSVVPVWPSHEPLSLPRSADTESGALINKPKQNVRKKVK